MASYWRRIAGAARLDAATYEDVEADRGALAQAASVVVLSSVAGGVGFGTTGVGGALVGSVVFLVEWVLRSAIVYYVGARLLPEPGTRADLGQLLRTLGFAAAPGLTRVAAVVPGLAAPVFVVTSLWLLAAMVQAVKRALDYESTARAITVCFLGWFLAVTAAFILGVIFGPPVY